MSGLRDAAQAVVDAWDARGALAEAMPALRAALAAPAPAPWEPYVPSGGISAADPRIGIQPSEYPLWCRTCHRPKDDPEPPALDAEDGDALYRWWQTLGATDQFIAYLNEKSNADNLAAMRPAPVPALDREPTYGPCPTRLDNQPTPSERPWRYGHAASIEGAHWDIYAGEGIDGWLVGMVTTEADAALIVEAVNGAALARDPAPPALDREEGIVQRAHIACCWCGEHHEEGR